MRIGPASAPVIPTEWSVPYVLFSWLFAAFGAFSALTFAERVAVERVEAIANAKDVRLALRRLPPPRPFGVLSAAFCAYCEPRARLGSPLRGRGPQRRRAPSRASSAPIAHRRRTPSLWPRHT